MSKKLIIKISNGKKISGKINEGIDAKIIANIAKSSWSTIHNGFPLLTFNRLFIKEPIKSPKAAP